MERPGRQSGFSIHPLIDFFLQLMQTKDLIHYIDVTQQLKQTFLSKACLDVGDGNILGSHGPSCRLNANKNQVAKVRYQQTSTFNEGGCTLKATISKSVMG